MKYIKKSEDVQLIESFIRWEYLHKYGGSDPFYSDGCNLNLVRNHIIHHKSKIAEEHPDGNYPDIYYQKTPLEVKNNYMAQADQIRINADQALTICRNDSNYKILLEITDKLSPENKDKTSIDNVIGYVRHLERAIAGNDLIVMRRANKDSYIKTFKQCAERVAGLAVDKQLSLF